ncbi:hypothetical protein WME98_06730 [Sorangium sp. So ce296]|uniref:restriction endonuclease n=1 Tax=Sorangium TaxID=39643 RepID=UPI003D9C1A6A
MVKVEEARETLASAAEDEDPIIIPASVLKDLTLDDIPEGASVQIGTMKEGVYHMEWNGRLYRDGGGVSGEAEHLWTRKYWYAPLGLEQYLDLVRRAVETRHRLRGDVELTDYDDDGAYIRLQFKIRTDESNPAKAYEKVRKISDEVEEVAERAADEVGKRIAEVAARLSGWGSEPLDKLVEKVETSKSTDDKGRSLEELASRLFEQIPGFDVTGRLRTATEEIDISILNDATEPRIRRESALLLAECKNWTSKCGKDEFVIFREKLENRKRRCSLGFLISWNGFTTTVTKEMLRGSREEALIVPVTGQDIRAAVRSGDVLKELVRCWDAAVTL